MSAHLRVRYQKNTQIFDIDRLNTATINNILLVSADKTTNIDIDYC
jgi:hypothetical protein